MLFVVCCLQHTFISLSFCAAALSVSALRHDRGALLQPRLSPPAATLFFIRLFAMRALVRLANGRGKPPALCAARLGPRNITPIIPSALTPTSTPTASTRTQRLLSTCNLNYTPFPFFSCLPFAITGRWWPMSAGNHRWCARRPGPHQSFPPLCDAHLHSTTTPIRLALV